MADDARSSRPIRRGFGLAALAVASADIAAVVSTSVSGGGASAGPVGAAAAARLPMAAYGVLLLALGAWCLATAPARSGRRTSTSSSSSQEIDLTTPFAIDEGDERSVIHALRGAGWYVADDVALPHGTVDHIAIGPAGILAVQVQWTNNPDPRGRPAVRARIAAQQLRKVLAARELSVEVVPAVLAFGPGLTQDPGGVKVVDAVAVLNGYQAAEWVAELGRRSLLPLSVVDEVRELIAAFREGDAPLEVRPVTAAVAG